MMSLDSTIRKIRNMYEKIREHMHHIGIPSPRILLLSGAAFMMSFYYASKDAYIPATKWGVQGDSLSGSSETCDVAYVPNKNSDESSERADGYAEYKMQVPLEHIIRMHAHKDGFIFKDNQIYRELRIQSASYAIDSLIGLDNSRISDNSRTILYVDKTFQKAMIFRREESGFLNIGEIDCSTAKIPGAKKRNGDGKTPEGLFRINSMIESYNMLYEGKKVYGPNMFHIQGSIYIHGNGTDTINVKGWKKDMAYSKPDMLGIHNNNFGYGLSHGCIRLDNVRLRELLDDGVLSVDTPVIIFENKDLTRILNEIYRDASYEKAYTEY
jgi:lipoprotein-anchoring transpeptidase ErfK/SrfK